VGVCRTDHQRRRGSVEESIAAANDEALVSERSVRKAQARTPFVLLDRNLVRVKAECQCGCVLRRGLLHRLNVIAKSSIDRQVVRYAEITLGEECKLKDVRRSDRAGGVRSGESLRVTCRSAANRERNAREALSESFQRVKAIRAEEVSREVVKDLVHDRVSAELYGGFAVGPGHVVSILLMVNVRGARAEAVASHAKERLAG